MNIVANSFALLVLLPVLYICVGSIRYAVDSVGFLLMQWFR